MNSRWRTSQISLMKIENIGGDLNILYLTRLLFTKLSTKNMTNTQKRIRYCSGYGPIYPKRKPTDTPTKFIWKVIALQIQNIKWDIGKGQVRLDVHFHEKKVFLIILRAKPWNLIFWYNPNKHNHFPIIWSCNSLQINNFILFSPYSWIVRNSVWENDRKQDAQNCIFFFVSNSKTCPKSKTLFY